MAEEHSEPASIFKYLLTNLKSNRQSICDAMVFALNHSKFSTHIANLMMTESLDSPETLKSRLYLASDILYNSNTGNVPYAWTYRTALTEVLPGLFERAKEMDRPDVREVCELLVELWGKWGCLEEKVRKGLESVWKTVPEAKEKALLPYITHYKRALSALPDLDLHHLCKKSGISVFCPSSERISKLCKLVSLGIDLRQGVPEFPVVKFDLGDVEGVPVERVLEAFEGLGQTQIAAQTLMNEDIEVILRLDRSGVLQTFSNSYIIKQ